MILDLFSLALGFLIAFSIFLAFITGLSLGSN